MSRLGINIDLLILTYISRSSDFVINVFIVSLFMQIDPYTKYIYWQGQGHGSKSLQPSNLAYGFSSMSRLRTHIDLLTLTYISCSSDFVIFKLTRNISSTIKPTTIKHCIWLLLDVPTLTHIDLVTLTYISCPSDFVILKPTLNISSTNMK